MMSVLSARHVEIGPASIPVSKKIPAVRVPDVQFQIIKQLVHVLLALRVTHSSDVYLSKRENAPMIQSVLTTKLAHSINAGILAKMPIPVEKVLNVKQRATVLFANVPMDGEDILLQNVSNVC